MCEAIEQCAEGTGVSWSCDVVELLVDVSEVVMMAVPYSLLNTCRRISLSIKNSVLEQPTSSFLL